jgi:hypothetical protein
LQLPLLVLRRHRSGGQGLTAKNKQQQKRYTIREDDIKNLKTQKCKYWIPKGLPDNSR